jgi:hypothetical protein
MRDEVLMSLVDRAMSDEEFRRRASEDLEGTLRDYGYELTEEELGAVREFHGQVAGKTDEELVAAVADARRQGG